MAQGLSTFGLRRSVRYVILLNNDSGKVTPDIAIKHHIAFLRDLDAKGKMIIDRPFIDYKAGMVVVKAESMGDATAIAKSDPLVSENYRTYEIRTWLLSCEDNNHLGRG